MQGMDCDAPEIVDQWDRGCVRTDWGGVHDGAAGAAVPAPEVEYVYN